MGNLSFCDQVFYFTKGENLSFITEQMGHTNTVMPGLVYKKVIESHLHEQVDMLNRVIYSSN